MMTAPSSEPTPIDIRRCADLLVDSLRALADVEQEVFRRELTFEQSVAVEAAILTEHGLFRCENCLTWRPINRLSTVKDGWCYACEKGYND